MVPQFFKEEKVYLTSKNLRKREKGKFRKHCVKPGYTAAECWILHPKLKPNTKGKKVKKKKEGLKVFQYLGQLRLS